MSANCPRTLASSVNAYTGQGRPVAGDTSGGRTRVGQAGNTHSIYVHRQLSSRVTDGIGNLAVRSTSFKSSERLVVPTVLSLGRSDDGIHDLDD